MIEENAVALGRLIGQTDEYKALRRAHEQIKDLPHLQETMGRAHDVAGRIDRAVAEGSEPPDDLMREYEQLVSSVQADPKYQAVVAAQSNFDKLMARVNEQIMEGIRKGSTSGIITLS